MSCWEQALWMGDVVADKDYVLTVSDNSGPAPALFIQKGSWWANSIIFWAWVEDQSGESLSLAVTFDTANQLVRFTSTSRTYSFNIPGTLVNDVCDGQTGADSWEAGGVFIPSFPVMKYDVGNAVFGSTSTRSMTGQATSTVGIVQPARSIQMQFAPGELTTWRALWASHFSRGRSCTFWHGPLPTSATIPFLSQIGAEDQLVVEPGLNKWSGQRTVSYRNIALQDEDAIEYRRRPNVPLSEPGLQSFYIPTLPGW